MNGHLLTFSLTEVSKEGPISFIGGIVKCREECTFLTTAEPASGLFLVSECLWLRAFGVLPCLVDVSEHKFGVTCDTSDGRWLATCLVLALISSVLNTPTNSSTSQTCPGL